MWLCQFPNLLKFSSRPWRPGKVAIEPPEMEAETSGNSALLFHEKTKIKHSQIIIDLLEKAIAQFQAFKSPRSKSHLTVTMAEELKSAQR